MHLVSASKAGMKAACDQSPLRTSGDRQSQPSAGGRVKRTPCLQQCLPFNRQTTRLTAKLRVHTRSLRRSNSTLSFLRVCRTLRRNEPSRSKQEESPDESMSFKSECVFRTVPVGALLKKALRARSYEGQAQVTWNSSSRKACLRKCQQGKHTISFATPASEVAMEWERDLGRRFLAK